uniref:Monoglyceride lipase n=1 Tax=Caligus clemensi TaxID=344056 RepID=C1BZV2_CALCM|nr:Monoglyceride lipase [Caligus clemensi]
MTASPSSSFFDAPDASKTDEIQRSKGGTLFTRDWEVPEPRGLAFISHGFSEHTKYYNEVAQALNGKKIYCFGHDHLGHGRSSGSRTLINSTDEYVEDVLHHVKLLQKKFPTLPMFIVAHSMGGLIALRCALISRCLQGGRSHWAPHYPLNTSRGLRFQDNLPACTVFPVFPESH